MLLRLLQWSRWDSPEGEARAAMAVLEGIQAYPWFQRLLVNAMDALSRFFKSDTLLEEIAGSPIFGKFFDAIRTYHLKHPLVQKTGWDYPYFLASLHFMCGPNKAFVFGSLSLFVRAHR